MTDWLEQRRERHCKGKQSYHTARQADAVAEKMTHKTHELLISYQCHDCGRWHIGHADESQILARVPTSRPTCVICRELISEARLKKAQYYHNTTTTCSRPCASELKRRRAQQKKPASPQDPPPSEPCPPVSQGVAKPPP